MLSRINTKTRGMMQHQQSTQLVSSREFIASLPQTGGYLFDWSKLPKRHRPKAYRDQQEPDISRSSSRAGNS
jgi:hypothetical protein